MMLAFVIFAVTFVVSLIALVIYLYPGASQPSTVPGMQPADPLLGNFPDISKAGSLHEFLMELHDLFGEIASFWWGTEFVVSVASPKLFKEFSTSSNRPALLFEMFMPLIGSNSTQYANGADWHRRHSTYSPALSHEAVSGYYKLLNKVGNELGQKLASLATEEHIPLREHCFSLAMKAFTQLGLGDFFMNDVELVNFTKYYDICWHEMEIRLLEGLPAEGSKRQERFDKALAGVKKIVCSAMEARRNKPAAEGEKILIDRIMDMGPPEERIIDDLITYVIASVHTTGLMMTWCLYFLASHPDVQEKVYKEMKDVLGDEPVTSTVANELVYTRQVIDETLRCSVLAPYAARYQESETRLGGHLLPKKTPVIHALGVVLQDDLLWPQPNMFDPDRFSEENTKNRPNFAFQPFGFGGKRKCPGYRLATSEAIIFLSILIRKFKVHLVEGQVIDRVYGLVTNPSEEVWVTVSIR